MKYVVNDQVVLLRPLEGPLAAHIASFARWTREQGYALCSLRRQILIAHERRIADHGVERGLEALERPAEKFRHLRARFRRLAGIELDRGDVHAAQFAQENFESIAPENGCAAP